MPPTLLIADTPYKIFPGGVVTVRCAEWVAAGGSGSVVVDPLAHDGEAVADSQQVSSIKSAPATAYDAATETLELVNCPLTGGQAYFPFISYRIEGETDLTDLSLLTNQTNEDINGGAVVGINVSTNRSIQSVLAPPLPHYRQTLSLPAWTPATSNPDIIVKTAAETGTTYEIFIDQITFVPDLDTEMFEHADPTLTTAIIDGADGGDANGIFTWTPYPGREVGSGQGDFQKKADASTAEWNERVVPDDALILITFTEQVPVQVYGMHGAGYRGERVWAEDTFDNRTTTSKDFGVDPTGYGYSWDGGTTDQIYVDGAGNGILQLNSADGNANVVWGDRPSSLDNVAQSFFLYDQWSWTGLLTYTDDAGMTAANAAFITLTPVQTLAGPDPDAGFISIDLVGQTWTAVFPDGGTSTHAISWLVQGAQLGWRIEAERYVIRYKLWDASGAEPAAFDDEEFISIDGVPGGFSRDYDYDDFLERSTRITTAFTGLRIDFEITDAAPLPTFPLQIDINYQEVSHDPGGTPGDIAVEFLSPEATSWGEITVPYGACYFVHWGSGSVQEQDFFGDWYLSYSSKVWDEIGAAEIQRAETVQWVMFRSLLNLIPMNWRSSDRSPRGQNRILSGG